LYRHRVAALASALLVLTLILPRGSSASADWLENIGLLVKVDGEPSGLAHVYDSDDYQRLLLVMEDRPISAIIDLAATTVYSIPRDSVAHGEDGHVETGEVTEEYLTMLTQEEGTLQFEWEESPVTIEPVPPLIGEVELERVLFLKPTYGRLAEKYEPDAKHLGVLKKIDQEIEIRVYFGTWCHICKKMIPPLIGTLAKAANEKLHACYFGVDEDLTEPAEEIDNYALSTTPTILLLREGKEIGRIEEELETTIEEALVAILQEQ
jgi:thiol-disulfide isomerase/thioredoxin